MSLFSRPSSGKEAAISALNKTISIFTSHGQESFDDVMANGMRPIVDLVNLDRVVIYNRIKADREKFGQFYRWDKSANGTFSLNDDFDILPSIPVVAQWLSILAKGECVIRRIDKMSEEEVSFSKTLGIKSVIIVPIFTQNEFWGAVSFQDHARKRDFGDYADLLRSVAYLCANTVIIEEMKQNNSQAFKRIDYDKKMMEALNRASIIFLSQSQEKFGDMMSKGVKRIADIVGLDRFSIWRNFMKADGRHVSQIYRWDRIIGGTTDPTDGLVDTTYKKLAPNWESILSSNNIINGPANQQSNYEVLKTFDCISVSSVPIFINDEFWGFGLFEDRHIERHFSADEIDVMRSAAFMCANTIVSNEMEDKIKDANEFSNSLLNSAPVALAICDEYAQMFECNDMALKIFECNKEYFIEHFYDLSPVIQSDGLNSKDKVNMLIKDVLKSGRVTFEWTHISYSGDFIPCEVTLIKANHKGKTIILIYIYDLRNIKKLELAATEAQDMTRAIAEASPVSYILFDEKLQVVDCNETAVQVLKSPSKQYLLDNYWNIFATDVQPDGQKSFEKSRVVLNQALAEGKNSFEWIQKTLDGEHVPVENTLYPFILKDKKFIISFKYDLRKYNSMMESIRKQSKTLAFQLERQQLVSEISKKFVSTESFYDIITGVLAEIGEYLKTSRAFIYSMNYEKSEVSSVYEWYKNDNIPKIRDDESFNAFEFKLFDFINKSFPRKLSKDSAASVVFCNDISADEKFSVLKDADLTSFISSPLYIEGSLWGILSIEQCDRVREWKDGDTRLVATVSNIISGAIMRNIYDTKLKETLDKITTLSKAKDEFLSKISHEIRTPMNAILGITEIQLQDETLPLKVIEGLSTIYSSGDSLLRIINDLLDLSKIEAGKMEIVPAKYDVASLVNDTVQLNMMRIESKPIEFKLNVDENIPAEFIGDELRVKQILNNILSNAFKYTDSGEVVMFVSSEKIKGSDDDVIVNFTVSDTGHGMTQEQLRRMFDEYSRFNLDSGKKIEGTGLGMSITQNLIRMMGGDISVESEPGKGSTFKIRLPQKSSGAKVLGKEMSDNLQKFRISSSSQMKRAKIIREPMPYGKVLVVDDVESNLYVARQLLTPYDLFIETATSGFEAIDKIKEGNVYDIVFMDHMMPKMDGIETVKIIREMGYNHPIIALTANAVAGKAEMFLQNGFDNFVSKPIDIRRLNDELNKFIRDKQTPEAIEKARSQKKDSNTYSHVVPATDVELLNIFARDAKKSLQIFESTLENMASVSEDDLHLFAINAHAMKSALANIGEKVLSQVAFALERAGKEQDKVSIAGKTPELVKELKLVIAKIEKKSGAKESDKDDDPVYLRKELDAINDACENYDGKTAGAVLKELKKKSWTKETGEILDKIGVCLLHSDFEEAGVLASDYKRKLI